MTKKPILPTDPPTAKAVDLSTKLMLFKGMDPDMLRGMVMFGAPGMATHLAGEPVPPTPPKSERH